MMIARVRLPEAEVTLWEMLESHKCPNSNHPHTNAEDDSPYPMMTFVNDKKN